MVRAFPPQEAAGVKNAVIGTGGLRGAPHRGRGGAGCGYGFDLALMGVSLAAGGGVGLFFASTKVGLFSSGALAFFYLFVLRKQIRSGLLAPNRPSNVDALVGRTGVVTSRLAPNAPGR